MQIKHLVQTIQTLTQPLVQHNRWHTAHGLAVRTALRAGYDDGRMSINLTPSSDQVMLDTDLPGTKHDHSGDFTLKFR